MVATEAGHTCRCSCGTVTFRTRAAPLFRMLCHCSICRRFNDAAHADVLVYRPAMVDMPPPGSVEFATYRPPPNVQRGKCSDCNQAAIEVFRSILMPNLVMVPAGMVEGGAPLPPALAHMFYEKRVAEATDDLPKHRGYIRSQLAFTRHLFGAMIKR